MRDQSTLAVRPRFAVVICGGAVAGSEAALVCAESGIMAIVIEQNQRPYGKVEDGLPRWMARLRLREYDRIDSNLNRPEVLFVPKTKLGKDLSFKTIREDWRPNAVLLANGAWRDRPLPVDGIEQYLHKGLVYQNPFVTWFNHSLETDYQGPRYEIVDNTIIVGGGLASIDVAKIINLELYARALRTRGIEVPLAELHNRGIPETLHNRGIDQAELAITGCSLYYRRRKKDMPLVDLPVDGIPEQKRKVENIRVKLMDSVIKKYLVRFQPCHRPVDPVIKSGRLEGLVFRRTEIKQGDIIDLAGTDYEVRAPMVVSSIGSIPETIEEIPKDGEFYAFSDEETGAFSGFDGVFGLGNVLTGRGNLKASRDNARQVTEGMIENYLGLRTGSQTRLSDAVHEKTRRVATEAIEKAMKDQQPLSIERLQRLLSRIENRWHEIGYNGDYDAWMANRRPLY